MNLIRVTILESCGIKANIEMPFVPYPGLILIDARGKKVRVTKVFCFLTNFSKGKNENNYMDRDPFGNAVQVETEPVE